MAFSGSGSGTQQDPYVITNVNQLQEMKDNLSAHYVLGNHIDASVTSTWNEDPANPGKYFGFEPIGNNTNRFTGSFDGQGYTIRGLYINRQYLNGHVGLFGVVGNANISNVRLANVTFFGQTIGGVAGLVETQDGIESVVVTISNVGIEGRLGQWPEAFQENVGGIVGRISRYSEENPPIVTLNNCYHRGVIGQGLLTNAGLVGNCSGDLTIVNCYSAAMYEYNIRGGPRPAGLVGIAILDLVNVTSSYWDSELSGATQTSGGGQGKTTAQMKQSSTFSGWDIDNNDSSSVWFMFDGFTYPKLWSTRISISSIEELQAVNQDLSGDYYLTTNIDASDTSTWNEDPSNPGTYFGFEPIGNTTTKFTGTFNGEGHIVENLYINRPATYRIGLFGYVMNGSIINIGVQGGEVTGNYQVGGLAGEIDDGTIENSFSSCDVNGIGSEVGGLVGRTYLSSIKNVYADGDVSCQFDYSGGLVGANYNTNITNAYVAGLVTGSSNVGGLVGSNFSGIISNSYWDIQTSGQSSSPGGGQGKTTSAMMQQATFVGWDFTNIWGINEGSSYPYLLMFAASPPSSEMPEAVAYFDVAVDGVIVRGLRVIALNDSDWPGLRVSLGNNVVGAVDLVDIMDENASVIRISTPFGVKSWRKEP